MPNSPGLHLRSEIKVENQNNTLTQKHCVVVYFPIGYFSAEKRENPDKC